MTKLKLIEMQDAVISVKDALEKAILQLATLQDRLHGDPSSESIGDARILVLASIDYVSESLNSISSYEKEICTSLSSLDY